MRPKKAITIALLAVMVFFVYYSSSATEVIDDGTYTYISNLKWHNTFAAGLEAAKAQGKPILVYGWATWCKFCRKYHEEVFPDPEVNGILKKDFVLVAVDLDTNKEDAKRFSFNYPPKLVFLHPDGSRITEIPGYVPKDTFLSILRQAREMHGISVELPENLPRSESQAGS